MGLKIQSAAKSKHTHAQHQEAISKIGGKLDSKIPRPYSNERKKKNTEPDQGHRRGGWRKGCGGGGEGGGDRGRGEFGRGGGGRGGRGGRPLGTAHAGRQRFCLVLEKTQKTKFEIAGEGMGQAKGTCFILPSLLPLLLSFLLYLLQIMSYGEFSMFLYKKIF